MTTFEIMIWSVYLVVTFFYGSIFTLLFLDIDLKERKNGIFFALFSLLCVGLQLSIGTFYSIELVIQFYPLLIHLPLLLICILLYRKSVIISLASVLLCYFLTSPRYVLATILVKMFPALPVPEAMGRILASLPLFIAIYKWVVPSVKQSFKREKKDIMYFFIPLTTVYIFSYLLYVYTDLLSTEPFLMVETILTLFFCIIVYFIHLYFVAFDNTLQLENRNHILDLSAEAMQKQLATLKSSSEETRILRHDIRHFSFLIKQYASEGNLDKIKELATDIEQKNDDLRIEHYCQNQSVNLILSAYLTPLRHIDIPYHLDIHFPREVFVSEMDLCTILGNALDNAVSSVLACPDFSTLSLEINCDTKRLFFKLENTCQQMVTFSEGLPLSTKPGHGYGSKSIAYLTEKYHGICSFSLKNHIFTTQVILHEYKEK